ncbi:MAG: hypothetical protein ABIJ09_19805 [Pseudomonadota bacterium]
MAAYLGSRRSWGLAQGLAMRGLLVLAAVGAFSVACESLPQQDTISACGGFAQTGQALTAEDAQYCEAEILHWRHDASSKTLILTDSRVPLNCCGEHSMTVHQDGEVYVVTERDEPEQIGPLPMSTARCDCMCVFDFKVEVQGVSGGVISVRLEREVTDAEGGISSVWQGEIDLAPGHGGVIIDETENMWCEASGG